MSACNIWQYDTEIDIWNDACAYSDCGEILGFTDKIVLLNDIHAAVVVQGDLRLLAALEVGLPDTFESFDALADGLTDFAEGLWHEVADKGFLPTIFKAAGYSEARKRLEVWSVAVGETVHHAPGPAQLIPQGQVFLSPAPPALFERLKRIGLHQDGALCCDSDAKHLEVMEEQRQLLVPYEVAGGRAIKMVGGWARHTNIRKGSVTSQIVKRWPSDEVGPRGRAAMAA